MPGAVKPWRDLGVPQDAPDLGRALQHRDLLAALREVGGGDEAVVAPRR